MQRYFVNLDNITDSTIKIVGGDVHHINDVMRMKINDRIYCCSDGLSYICEIVEQNKDFVLVNIIEKLDEHKELPVNVTIAQGMVRKEKMEEVIDYITELGAFAYKPVIMRRSVVKMDVDLFEKKRERLNTIAKEASEQSHRTKLLKVDELVTWKQFIKESSNYDLCLYAYEASSKDESFKKILKNHSFKSILVLVGPEGGIDEIEVEDMKKVGFLPITLGPRILRTQVAPLYIMSAISYELEALDD